MNNKKPAFQKNTLDPINEKEIKRNETLENLKTSFKPESNIFERIEASNKSIDLDKSQIDYFFHKAKQELQHTQYPSAFGHDKIKSILASDKMTEMSKTITQDFNKLSILMSSPNGTLAVEDAYGNMRGACEICSDDCTSYSPSGARGDETWCATCGCGASAHKIFEVDEFGLKAFIASIKNDIIPTLARSITDDKLNFNCFLAVYKILDKTYTKNDCSGFLKILREAGFTIIKSEIKILQNDEEKELLQNNLECFYNQEKLVVSDGSFIKQRSMTINKFEVPKLFLDQYIASNTLMSKDTTFEGLAKLEKKMKFLADNNTHNGIIPQVNEEGEQYENSSFWKSFVNRTKKMKKLIHSTLDVQPKFYEDFSNPVLTLCISIDTESHISFFEQFTCAISNADTSIKNIISKIKLIYYSKSRSAALWDLQVVFPSLFRIDKNVSLLSFKPKLSSNQSDVHLKDEESTSSTSEKEKRLFKKEISRYRDVLLSNSISLVSLKLFHTASSLSEDITYQLNYANIPTSVMIINYMDKYLLHNQRENLPVGLARIQSIGKLNLHHALYDHLDIVDFHDPEEHEELSLYFFPDDIKYSRVLLILRPFLVRSGLGDVIIHMFQLNQFVIIKRKVTVLTKAQISYLYSSEIKSGEIDMEDYMNMMGDSNAEIVVMSKFSAVKDLCEICGFCGIENGININLLNSISNNLEYINLNVEYEVHNDLIHKDDKIKTTKYQAQFVPFHESCNLASTFHDISSLIHIDQVFISILKDKNDKCNSIPYGNISKIRTNLLKFASFFNLFVYNSKSISTCEKEVNYFFPYLADMEEVFLLCKNFEPTREIFRSMAFEVLEVVKYQLTEEEFSRLFEQYFASNLVSPFDYSTSKEYFLANEIQIVRMVKPGGLYELKKIIGKENYNFIGIFHPQLDDKDRIHIIQRQTFLLELSQSIEYYYPFVNEKIHIIEGGYLAKYQREIIIDVLNSCLKCTKGEDIRYEKRKSVKESSLIERYLKFYHYDDEKKINEYFINVLNSYMFTRWSKQQSRGIEEKLYEYILPPSDTIQTHLGFITESNQLGFYEIRIPILDVNISSTNWKVLDMADLLISRNYLYIDNNFYNELNEKFNTNKIHLSHLPFERGHETIKTFLHAEDNIAQFNTCLSRMSFHSLDKDDNINNTLEKFTENTDTIRKRILYKTKFESCKHFYKACSYIGDDSVTMSPKNYHYRIKPEDITMDIKRIYEVEEFGGIFFIEVVAQDFMKYRPPEKGNHLFDDGYSALYTPSIQFQYSLPAFLWGRKLSQICKKVENCFNGTNIDNCGPIIYYPKSQRMEGIIHSKYIYEYEEYLYVNILSDIKTSGYEFFTADGFTTVENKLMQVLQSKIFKQTRTEDNIRLMPTRISENNVRICKNDLKYPEDVKEKQNEKQKEEDKEEEIKVNQKSFFDFVEKEKEKETNEKLKGTSQDDVKANKKENIIKKSLINPEHELKFHSYFKNKEDADQISKEISNKSAYLIDLFCFLGIKYHMYAAILFFIKIYLKKISRKSYLITSYTNETNNSTLFNSEIEYDKMLDAILAGISSNMDINSKLVNDKDTFNAYKIEYFFYCLKEIRFLLNEITLYKDKLKVIDKALGSMRSSYKVNSEISEQISDYERLKSILTKNVSEQLLNIEIIFNELVCCEVTHKVDEAQDYKISFVPKERYHIPMYFNEKWERDLTNEKYFYEQKIPVSYLQNTSLLKEVSHGGVERELFSSGGFKTSSDYITIQKSLLREPIPEPPKEIKISKRKRSQDKRHPIKLFAELIRRQNNL